MPASALAWPRPAAILFDLDGTLVDTAQDLGAAANAVRAQRGLPPLPLSDYRSVASAGARGLLGKAIGMGLDHPEWPAHRDAFLAHYAAHIAQQSQLFEGMDAVLAACGAQGIAWGVATNKPSRYTQPLMTALQLLSAAAIVSADEVPAAKPAPDALLLAAERAGVTARDCWYVGDDKRDIDAGKAAGMRTIAAAWGYEGEHPLATWGADITLHRPIDLLTLLP